MQHQPRQNTQTWGSNAWGWDTVLWWSCPQQGLLLKAQRMGPFSFMHLPPHSCSGCWADPTGTWSYCFSSWGEFFLKRLQMGQMSRAQERQPHVAETKDRTVLSRGNAILSWLRCTTKLWLLGNFIFKSSHRTKKLLHVMNHSFATDGPTEDRRHVSATLRHLRFKSLHISSQVPHVPWDWARKQVQLLQKS